jgi:hypothetical protein
MTALVAPGARSPLSTVPSSKTMWCVAESLFVQANVVPVLMVAGSGVNDWAPLFPTIEIVFEAPPPDVTGVGLGLVLEYPLLPPQADDARVSVVHATTNTPPNSRIVMVRSFLAAFDLRQQQSKTGTTRRCASPGEITRKTADLSAGCPLSAGRSRKRSRIT